MFPVVVSDLDGTLLNDNHQLSQRTKEVIRRLSQQGIKFVFATGRHYEDVEFIRAQLGIDMYLITSNGARVHDMQGNKIIEHNIAEDIVQPLLDMRKPYGDKIHTNVFQNSDWLVEVEIQSMLDFHKDSGFSYKVQPLSTLDTAGVQKLFYISEDHELLVKLSEEVESRFGSQVSATFSMPYCYEVMAAGISKAFALKEVLKLKGHEFKDVIAFGDGLNDVQMLGQVGKGLLMGNADERLVKLLPDNEQIGFCNDDAVAEYLEAQYLN